MTLKRTLLKQCFSALLLAVILILPREVNAQNKKVTLDLSDVTLKECINAIENQTQYLFVYNDECNLQIRVSVSLKDQTLPQALDSVLASTDITYRIEGGSVILTKRSQNTVLRRGPMNVKGVVLDADGLPVIGAAVMLKGTSTGVITDIDGVYSVDIPSSITAPVLVVDCLGFESAEVAVGNKSKLDILMKTSSELLDDVVVVGYGSMKKRDLVGAVDKIDSEVFEERSNPSISRSLQGSVPNLNISMRDGKPSRSATIDIRGASSIGSGGGALVLIDGVEGNLETVNPQDIASVSVLKDASSAAIYGARGAFGVILVTTKSAKDGDISISYNGSVSVHSRTVWPELVTNGYEWTTGYINAWNGYYNGSKELNKSINNIVPYSNEWYTELGRRNVDHSLERIRINDSGVYEYFGNTDWTKLFFKDHNYSQEHNVSVSGGNKISTYYVSGRLYDQDGVYKVGNERFRQYNVRAKGDIKVTDWLKISNNLYFVMVDYHQPMLYYSQQLVPRMLEHAGQPISVPKNPDGTWTYAAVLNGYAAFTEGTSYQQEDKFTLTESFSAQADIIKDVLKLQGDLSYLYGRNSRDRVTNMYTSYTSPTSTTTVNETQGSTLQNVRYDTNYLSSNIFAEYSPKLGDNHTLKVLAGWNLETKSYRTLAIKRSGLNVPNKPSFNLMSGVTDNPESDGYDWSYVGFFGRVNYSFRSRYLLEMSARYDGSSKFPENSKWGFFPSASFAWRLSEEKWMDWSNHWLDNFKIRVSAGSMGNGNITTYQYIDYMDINTSSVVIGDNFQSYTTAPGAIPLSLTWETSTTYDIGADIEVLKNRLSTSFDFYRRNTTDMYTVGVSLPAVYGTSSPKGNNASLKTDGWELTVGWRDDLKLCGKDFSYNIKAMLWDNTTVITKYINPTGDIGDYYEGMKIGDIWGYRVEGLFRDQDDIDSHAVQSFLQSSDKVTLPGQVKFADLNQDGKIDKGSETLDNHGDLDIIGNTSARYQFGVNLGFNWNGIGLSAFFQGVGKKDWYPRYDSGYFWGQYNRPFGYMLKAHAGDNVYREELDNWDTAYWPRYASYQTHEKSNNRVLTTPNDRYLQNVAYVRLKNLTIDYSFSQEMCAKMRIKGLKLFLSGENLWTWSPMFKYCDNYDPEVIKAGDADFRTSEGDGYSYPMLRTLTFGVNLKF